MVTKKLVRPKFQPPVNKNPRSKNQLNEYNPYGGSYNAMNAPQNNFYSYNNSGYANPNRNQPQILPNSDIINMDEINGHINDAYQSVNSSQSSQSLSKILQNGKRSFNPLEKKPVDNSKKVKFNPCIPQTNDEDEDMESFFNKVKSAKPSIQPFKKPEAYHKSVDSESDSNSEEDPDIALDKKIEALSSQNSLSKAHQNSVIDYSDSKANCAVENDTNKLNNFMASLQENHTKVQKDSVDDVTNAISKIRLKNNPCPDDTTCNEDMNDDDIMNLLGVQPEEVEVKPKEESLPEPEVGNKRKIDQIETDMIQLPSREISDKRYKIDISDEYIQEISLIASGGLTSNLKSFSSLYIDLSAPPVEIQDYIEIYKNRKNYSNAYIQSIIEMMKYQIEEDFDLKKQKELPMVAASLELVQKKARQRTGAFDK